MDDIVGIFPTPVMIAREAVPPALVRALIDQFEASQTGANVRTALLAHTPMADPRSSEVYVATLRAIGPRLRAYGRALMGEELGWAIKEIWVNRMETGGAQKMHNHANSFVSGVIYLTEVDASAATVFHRHMGHATFVLENQNPRCEVGAFNSPIFAMPQVAPGDMVLFPSYMMHEVPPNRGGPRMTAAFNALPERLDSWGYELRFR
jgi:uncharacterized protein (TIGR02466 family)